MPSLRPAAQATPRRPASNRRAGRQRLGRPLKLRYARCRMDAILRGAIRRAAEFLLRQDATAVYIFGSAAEGRLRDDSDVDLAVTGLSPAVFFRVMADVSRIVGRPVDLVLLDHQTEVAETLRA